MIILRFNSFVSTQKLHFGLPVVLAGYDHTDLPCTVEISEFSQTLAINLNEILKLNLTFSPDKNTTLVIIIHLLHKLHKFIK